MHLLWTEDKIMGQQTLQEKIEADKAADLRIKGLKGAVPIIINGEEYHSLGAAAQSTGISYNAIHKTYKELRKTSLSELERVFSIRHSFTLSIPKEDK